MLRRLRGIAGGRSSAGWVCALVLLSFSQSSLSQSSFDINGTNPGAACQAKVLAEKARAEKEAQRLIPPRKAFSAQATNTENYDRRRKEIEEYANVELEECAKQATEWERLYHESVHMQLVEEGARVKALMENRSPPNSATTSSGPEVAGAHWGFIEYKVDLYPYGQSAQNTGGEHVIYISDVVNFDAVKMPPDRQSYVNFVADFWVKQGSPSQSEQDRNRPDYLRQGNALEWFLALITAQLGINIPRDGTVMGWGMTLGTPIIQTSHYIAPKQFEPFHSRAEAERDRTAAIKEFDGLGGSYYTADNGTVNYRWTVLQVHGH